MSIASGELAIIVDGRQVYSYKATGGAKPTDAELLAIATGSQ